MDKLTKPQALHLRSQPDVGFIHEMHGANATPDQSAFVFRTQQDDYYRLTRDEVVFDTGGLMEGVGLTKQALNQLSTDSAPDPF